MKNEEWIGRNNMVYVGKNWIECYYYKWYSVRFLSCGCFEGVAASNKAYFAVYFLLDETVFISSVNEMCGECVETRVTLAGYQRFFSHAAGIPAVGRSHERRRNRKPR